MFCSRKITVQLNALSMNETLSPTQQIILNWSPHLNWINKFMFVKYWLMEASKQFNIVKWGNYRVAHRLIIIISRDKMAEQGLYGVGGDMGPLTC